LHSAMGAGATVDRRGESALGIATLAARVRHMSKGQQQICAG
jgi:hypothetical protein